MDDATLDRRTFMQGAAGSAAALAATLGLPAAAMAERIAFHTGQPIDQIEEDSDRDRWFSAEEAREYGFIDHVVGAASDVPSGAGTRA